MNYRGHSDRVMTVAWSLIDSDVLFSGSGDFTVHSWRISEQIFKEPPLEGASFLCGKRYLYCLSAVKFLE